MLRLNILWLINIYSLLLASFDKSYLKQLLQWCFPNGEFLSFLLCLLVEMCSKEELSFLHFLFIFKLFIYKQHGFIDSYFFLWDIKFITIIIFVVVQIILDLATGSPFKEIPVFFLTYSYHSLGTFLVSDIFLKGISIQWASSFHKGIYNSNVSVLFLCLPSRGLSGEY